MAITRTGGSWKHEYVEDSSLGDDIRTYTKANGKTNIPNGSTCLDMAKSEVWCYSRDADTWKKL